MINIRDIEERLKNNPVPREVLDMRENILNAFKNLEFIEDGHQYFLHNEDGSVRELQSVSTLIKEFELEIDWDEKAEFKALSEGVPVEVIKRRWEENNVKATNSGSLHHLFAENLMKIIIDGTADNIDPLMKQQFEKGYLIPSSPKQEAIVNYWEDLMNVPEIYPLLPEVKMYLTEDDNRFGIKRAYCGTADITLAMKYKGEWGIIVHDYKTNFSLTNAYARAKQQYMLPPFNDFIDESLSHYTFQLSAYSLMLMNLGYKVFDRKLIWLKNDGDYEKVKLPDITDRIIDFYRN